MLKPNDRHEPPRREPPRDDRHTRRGMHNSLGYQLRQVSKEIRRLQREAQALNTRPEEAETCSNGARRNESDKTD